MKKTVVFTQNTGWWQTYPSEKMMEFVSWDDDIPFPNCFWKANPNSMVPNQQPEYCYMTIVYTLW